MGFALAAIVARGAGMAGMAGAFVLHDQALGAKAAASLSRIASATLIQ